jgi:hypothetical protein
MLPRQGGSTARAPGGNLGELEPFSSVDSRGRKTKASVYDRKLPNPVSGVEEFRRVLSDIGRRDRR